MCPWLDLRAENMGVIIFFSHQIWKHVMRQLTGGAAADYSDPCVNVSRSLIGQVISHMVARRVAKFLDCRGLAHRA